MNTLRYDPITPILGEAGTREVGIAPPKLSESRLKPFTRSR